MPYNPSLLLVWIGRLLLALLVRAAAPNEFWIAVLEYIEVPDPVKELVNPLLGAICIVMVQAVYDYYKKLKDPAHVGEQTPHWIFGAKIFVGWIVGINSISIVQPFITASGPKIAFWAGAVGFGLIGGLVSLIIKLILKQQEEPKP